MSKDTKFYVVHVYGGTEPNLVSGAIDNYDDLLGEARNFYRSEEYTKETDSLFCLSIDEDGVPYIDSFSNIELEDEE